MTMSADTAIKTAERTPIMESNATKRDRELLIEVLKRELAAAREREHAARERDAGHLRLLEASHQRIAHLEQKVEQMAQRLQ